MSNVPDPRRTAVSACPICGYGSGPDESGRNTHGGCLFSFLFFALFIIIPIVAGIVAFHFNASFNLGDWMFHDFPSGDWYTQGLWHFAIVAAVSGILSSLIVTKVFRVYVYHSCPSCGAVWRGRRLIKEPTSA